jgi:hypothetical protein
VDLHADDDFPVGGRALDQFVGGDGYGHGLAIRTDNIWGRLGFAQWIASVKPEITSLKQSKVSLKCPKPTACRSIEASKGRWEPMRRSASSPSLSHVDRATYANKNCIRGMGMFRLSILAAAAVTLVSCATPYQDYGVLGGLDAKELRPNVDRVSFQGQWFDNP